MVATEKKCSGDRIHTEANLGNQSHLGMRLRKFLECVEIRFITFEMYELLATIRNEYSEAPNGELGEGE